MILDRRRTLALTAALPWVPWPARAAARRCAGLSLLADQFDVVYAQAGTGSHLDRNNRRSFDAGRCGQW